MSKGRSQMRRLDRTILIRSLPTPHSLDEVSEVVASLLPRRSLLPPRSEEDLEAIVSFDHHVTFRPIEDVPHAGSVFFIGAPMPHLKLDHLLLSRIVIERSLYLRCLLVVIEEELCA